MKYHRIVLVCVFVTSLIAVSAHTPSAYSQSPQVIKKTLLKTSLSGDDAKDAVIVDAVFERGATTGRHTHPGDEYTVVLEGTLELLADGSETRRVGSGDAYHNPAGVPHEARNVGDGPARVTVTFILEKGKSVTQSVE